MISHRRHRLSVCLRLPIERRQRGVNAGLGVEISRRYVVPRHVGVQGGARSRKIVARALDGGVNLGKMTLDCVGILPAM